MTATGFRNQVQNKNFLSPTGFKFILNRAPKVVFFSNQVNIPGINLGVTEQPTYLTDIPIPGDKIEFNDLNLRFLVDEDLENYLEIQHWIRGLGTLFICRIQTSHVRFQLSLVDPDQEKHA